MPRNNVTLSRRDKDMIQGIVSGNSNTEIALHLGLSKNTVRSYMTTLFSKLGVSGRVDVAYTIKRLKLELEGLDTTIASIEQLAKMTDSQRGKLVIMTA